MRAEVVSVFKVKKGPGMFFTAEIVLRKRLVFEAVTKMSIY